MPSRKDDAAKARGKALSGMIKTRLLPWLAEQGFHDNPFFPGSGSFTPAHDTWSFHLARLEGRDEIAFLELYAWRTAGNVKFYYNRIGLADPIDDLREVPIPLRDHEGILHRDHLLQRISDAGPVRRPLGLHITRTLRMRGSGSLEAKADRLFDEITTHLGDLSPLRAKWEAQHRLLRLGRDGHLLPGPG